jgi:hypothetical protein
MAQTGPDFSGITSQQQAKDLAAAGQLEPLILLPTIFGGRDDIPENIVYVPIGLADIKRDIDENVVAPLAREGKVTRYTAEPRYAGNSFIPTEITIVAADPGSFTMTLTVWEPTE